MSSFPRSLEQVLDERGFVRRRFRVAVRLVGSKGCDGKDEAR